MTFLKKTDVQTEQFVEIHFLVETGNKCRTLGVSYYSDIDHNRNIKNRDY